ncbi:hypothetical protein CK203_035478 [Vitis vinifera]|uniref:Uncharacterized protein n=1 Tax=Vitis vinifera TaxID=29760 RepID=A0A438I3M6_VITVI|nr:hypothetical protein CK203_035478 [Vitis vinifera]
MNFMSYVAVVSRGWDEPNARDMGIMKSQPNAKGEMYISNDGIDMKAKIATMARRLEELEMKKMQEVQAISQTPLQPMPCAICLSYEHLVEECPTILAVREMFGDCNTYNSNWRNHPNFSWKPQPPQYKQHVQAPQQASNLEQAIVNLSKVGVDFVGAQKSINAQLSQRIDSVESSLNKRMDEIQNDLSQKIDNLQYSISRLIRENLHKRDCKNDERKGREERILAIGSISTSGHIWSTFSSPFYTYYIPFRSSGSQESNSLNGVQIGVETKKLWSLQENCTELSGNFAHLNPRCENLSPRCEFSKHQFRTPLFKVRKFSHRAKHLPGARVAFRTPQFKLWPFEDDYAKLNGNVAAAPNFATVRHVFEALSGAQIMHTICRFEAWEVRNLELQTVCELDLKRRSYGHLKTYCTKLSGNFAP